MNNRFITIIIPAYNEEARILISLKKLIGFINNNKFNFEIIIVDDGSVDNTYQTVKEYFDSVNLSKNHKVVLIKNSKNKGKGYSVREGFKNSNGEFVLFSDADFSTPIEESLKMLNLIEKGYDIVIGSRALEESVLLERQNPMREYMGKIFNVIVRKVFSFDFKDTQCGFKMFKKSALDLILPYLTVNDFSFDVEILLIAQSLKLKIKELPVSWANSQDSKVSPVKDSLKMLASLVKIKSRTRKNIEAKI